MDEAEWLARMDSLPMLEFLGDAAGDRELRLVACGCCRAAWNQLWGVSRRAVEVAERFADAQATAAELIGARRAVERGYARDRGGPDDDPADWACDSGALDAALHAAAYAAGLLGGGRESAAVVRDIFGPLPFRPVTVAPAWRTPTAVAVARAITDNRTFHDLPVLADALEDAGCDSADLLAHCRGGGVHVRGCWAVDLVLGKR